ncbi:DUF3005 domain-containing protein [Burkholderia mayonis]|uniref:2-oxoglutarate dehydrogenase n=1 Tax=Burkholderia mayonis TaxID=1385591 RepID=A0A1B4FQL4_9BURK|nr:DUF3005 domain-containing protein [Burkholderia mayonis]AOJ05944.1 hypothetical protein WS71_00350 [Burkholderia mayonis]KVE54051.1 hypothetical protein WS71_00125 [Burkholderia mayonis]
MTAMNPSERKTPADAGPAHPRSVELYNDATHDSTVDTDGKNREAARIASGEPISPDQITTSNASLVNAMSETPDGFAGFDSRPGGNHPQFAPRAGYTVVDKGFDAAASGGAHADDELPSPYHPPRRPGRIIEFAPIPR